MNLFKISSLFGFNVHKPDRPAFGAGLGAGWESVLVKAGIYRHHPIQLRLFPCDTAGRSEHFASISGYPTSVIEAQNLLSQGEGGSLPPNKLLVSLPIGHAAAWS